MSVGVVHDLTSLLSALLRWHSDVSSQMLCDPTGVESKRSVHIRATFARHASTRFGKSASCLPGDIPVSKIRDLNTALCCFAISPLVSLYALMW